MLLENKNAIIYGGRGAIGGGARTFAREAFKRTEARERRQAVAFASHRADYYQRRRGPAPLGLCTFLSPPSSKWTRALYHKKVTSVAIKSGGRRKAKLPPRARRT